MSSFVRQKQCPGADPGGGGSLGSGPPPPLFFVGGGGGACARIQCILILDSYPDPPFPNPVSGPECNSNCILYGMVKPCIIYHKQGI